MGMLVTEIDQLDEDIEFELIESGKLRKSSDSSNNYVNNKEFYEELVKYHEHKKQCLQNDQPIPPLTEKIGLAIIQIATRRCNSRMYVGYSQNWKQEMIANAILIATIRGHNFDPEKSQNPFAYFTQICDNAIKEQLKKEKAELYVRYKSFEDVRGYLAEEDVQENVTDTESDTLDVQFETRLDYIDKYEQSIRDRKEKNKKQTEEDLGLLQYLDDEFTSTEENRN